MDYTEYFFKKAAATLDAFHRKGAVSKYLTLPQHFNINAKYGTLKPI